MVPAMLAMISTASKTTASLSEAKKRKIAPLCHVGRGEEIIAMGTSDNFGRNGARFNRTDGQRQVVAPGQPVNVRSAIRFSQRFRSSHGTGVDRTRSGISPWQIAGLIIQFILSGALAFRRPLAWSSRVCHSARPRFPPTPNRFGVARDLHFFQPI